MLGDINFFPPTKDFVEDTRSVTPPLKSTRSIVSLEHSNSDRDDISYFHSPFLKFIE